jgi:hypothetical protein
VDSRLFSFTPEKISDLHSVYAHICVSVNTHAASEEHGIVTLSSWLQFCSDAKILDNAQRGCTRADLAVSGLS